MLAGVLLIVLVGALDGADDIDGAALKEGDGDGMGVVVGTILGDRVGLGVGAGVGGLVKTNVGGLVGHVHPCSVTACSRMASLTISH